WIFCILPLLPIIIKLWPSVSIIVANTAFLLIPFFVVLIVAVELEWRRRERRALANREEQQRLYVSKLHEETEKARRHLAQELHDESIQMLLTVNTRVENLLPPGSGTSEHSIKTTASWIHDTISQTVDNMRRVCLNLRPSILDDLGLVPALRWLVDNANAETDTTIRIKVIGEERKLPVSIEDNVFRLVQAALSNIRRHSGAEKATVTLRFDEEHLKLFIEDNGRGFNVPKVNDWFAVNGKLGLVGMYQRASSLEGVFHINSKPGKGTVISIELEC
ncbi:MAG: sensor histidine kinase, partial [Dehalococcoidia bacterium]